MATPGRIADALFLKQHERARDSSEDAGEALDIEVLQAELQDTLQQLEKALETAILGSRSASKEARQWLINSIAALELADGATKRRRFSQYLPGGAACRGKEYEPLGRALLELMFESPPAELGGLLAGDAELLRHFFKADPQRVPLWFGHFSMEGMRRFKLGAAALAQFALARRAEMWDLLAWQGRHPQAPVAVAQRTHYFCELDVSRTLRHLIKDCPAFWRSQEMQRSVEANVAQLLSLDPPFWSKELLRWLGDAQSRQGQRLYHIICGWLEAASWRQCCQRLLHLLPQRHLLPFAQDLLGSARLPAAWGQGASGATQAAGGSAGAGAGPRSEGRGAAVAEPATAAGASAVGREELGAAPAQPGAWLVFRGVQWPSLDALVVAAALGCCLPPLLRLLREGEMGDERALVHQLVHRLLGLHLPPQQQQAVAAAHWRLRQRLRQQLRAQPDDAQAAVELSKLLLLQLFASACLVHELSTTGRPGDAALLQSLLSGSGFACRLAAPADSRGRRSSSSGAKKRKHRRHEKKKHKKKRRRRSRSRSSSGASSGADTDDGGHGGSGQAQAEEWLALRGTSEDGLAEGGEQAEQLWVLGPQRGGKQDAAAAVSSLGLLDAVVAAAASAHASWLLSK